MKVFIIASYVVGGVLSTLAVGTVVGISQAANKSGSVIAATFSPTKTLHLQ